MPTAPTATQMELVAVEKIVARQTKIDALQRAIDYDRTALGIRSRLEKQIKRLRAEMIDFAYEGLPEG